MRGLAAIGKGLAMWGRRLRWRVALDGRVNVWRHLRARHLQTLTFDQPEMEKYFADVSNIIVERCRRSLQRSSNASPGRRSRCAGVLKLAFVWLQRSLWGAIPTDKDAGFALVKKNPLVKAIDGL